ncbi:MAG: exodeoxyribonuclease III [Cytophagales bacterium]|nr:MAG: exodeoxyribonuclease III [Cytophagales bacterium]
MLIITYNVNGLRSALSKDFLNWLKATNADIVCLQEIKCELEQIKVSDFEHLGYNYIYFHSAQKKGYSGVAILSKIKPLHIEIGCGIDKYDDEGRVIRCDFETFSLMNVYMPSGSSGEERQNFKFQWMNDFFAYIEGIKERYKELIVCGDFNICHESIDIHNPKSNANSSGFLPEERAWITKLLQLGFIDTFRDFNKEAHHYTWWSYRAGARKKNLGWRIDYFIASESLKNRISRTIILSEALHSDHCPVMLDMK